MPKVKNHTYFKMATVTFLGTGTSQGVPVIGCRCAVCQSSDARDKRLRSSVLYTKGETQIVIDAGPDFRQQMLRAEVDHLDAIFLTHEHNDHVIGIDDVRPFNFRSGHPMRIYAEARVTAEIRKRFEYVFGEEIPGLPRIELIDIEPGIIVTVGDVAVQAIRVMHGRLPILAFRIGEFGYITDMKTIEVEAIDAFVGVKHLVTSALHHREHHAHMSLEEALTFSHNVQQQQPELQHIWLTHMSHHMGLTSEVELDLPDFVQFAHDQLQLELS